MPVSDTGMSFSKVTAIDDFVRTDTQWRSQTDCCNGFHDETTQIWSDDDILSECKGMGLGIGRDDSGDYQVEIRSDGWKLISDYLCNVPEGGLAKVLKGLMESWKQMIEEDPLEDTDDDEMPIDEIIRLICDDVLEFVNWILEETTYDERKKI